jgi:hypothetical protein
MKSHLEVSTIYAYSTASVFEGKPIVNTITQSERHPAKVCKTAGFLLHKKSRPEIEAAL